MEAPSITLIKQKNLVGKRRSMSFAHLQISELWRSFMLERKNISNPLNTDLVSMAVYSPNHFSDFQPTKEFERWAAVEVSDLDAVPDGMETFILPGGLYAVFHYKGLHTDASIFQYIFGTWLPASDYCLDNRPHLEILGEKYKNNDPDSEEDIWIPIKPKA